MKAGSLVFVYGSLMSGMHNHGVLGFSHYVGDATLSGATLYRVSSFPGLKLSDNPQDAVHGEVYEIVDDLVASRLDILEGHPRHYRREERIVDFKDTEGYTEKAWVYVYQYSTEFLERVPSGDWREYQGKQAA